jgi:KaiC/GvpD/RAD55 family RecA-like ATPase
MPETSPSPVDNAIRLVVAGATVFPVRLALDADGKKKPAYPGSWDQYQMTAATAGEIATAGAYGVDCGRSGVVYVDLDRKADIDGVELWKSRGLPVSPFVVKTQSGGEHHAFRAPTEPVGNACFKTLGVDVRGAGGHVFGPGSTVEGGGSYALVGSLPASLADLPEYPADAVEALRAEDKANKRAQAAERRPEAFTPAPPGSGTVEQCEHRVREQMAILEESVSGGFNDELNRLCFLVGQLCRAENDHWDEPRYAVEDVRDRVIELCEESEAIGPLDATDWGTINSSGAQSGLDSPYNPGGPTEAELSWSDMITVEAPAPINADPLAGLYVVEDQPAVAGPPRSRLWGNMLDVDRLKGDPPPTPPFVLEGLLREGELAALVAGAGAGKSLLTFERALQAISVGRRVIYFDAENSEHEIHTRVAAYGFNADEADLTGLEYLSFPSLSLDAEADARELLTFVAELTVTKGKIDAVIFDTASRFIAGVENDAAPWLAMYRLALLPLKRAGIAVLRLDHMGKDETKGARGNSAKSGDVDTIWELQAGKPPPGKKVPVRVELTCTKQRSGTHAQYTVLSRDVDANGVLGHRVDGSMGDGVMPTMAPPRVSPVDDVVAVLDRSGCPNDTGRPAAQDWLRDRGVPLPKAGTTEWAAAIRERKSRPVQDPVAPPEQDPHGAESGTDELSWELSQRSTKTKIRTAVPDSSGQLQDSQDSLAVCAGQAVPGAVPMIDCSGATGTVVPALGLSIGQPRQDSLKNDHEDGAATGDETEGGTPPPAKIKKGRLTDEEKAERKLAQTEARRAAAAEKRALALAEASGPRVELPAVVDRAGTIRELTLAEAMHTVSAAHERSGSLTVDVETTGRPMGHREYALRTVQLGDALEAVVFDATQHAAAVKTLLGEADKLHAFSASADLVPLIAAGLADESIWARMLDVVIPAKLADPSSTGSSADGLKDLSGDILGKLSVSPAAEVDKNAMFKAAGWLVQTKFDTPTERNGWAQVDPNSSTMVRYAACDVLDGAALALKLPWPAPALLERERVTAEMTSRVAHQSRGLKLDAAKVAELFDAQTAAKAEAAKRVAGQGVTPGSDAQVAAKLTEMGVVLPRTKPSKTHPTGQPSAAEGAIEPLLHQEGPWQPLVRAVLDYREHSNRLSLFLGPWRELIENGDGRARPTVYTLEAKTGRMSCRRPNFQQVPKVGGFRACVVTDPGYLGISADFSGVEVRTGAALSGDTQLAAMIEREDELGKEHGLLWTIAREVWGPDATKAEYYAVKGVVYGRFYGGGVDTLADNAGISKTLAASTLEVLDSMTPTLARWSRALDQGVKAGRTMFETYSGRTIHLDPKVTYKAGNYAIQGTARELLVDGLMRWRETRWGTCTLLPVHDELIVMVPADEAKEATAELVRCMETELYGVKIKVEADEPWTAWPDAA